MPGKSIINLIYIINLKIIIMNRTEQNRTEQNRTEQNRTDNYGLFLQ